MCFVLLLACCCFYWIFSSNVITLLGTLLGEECAGCFAFHWFGVLRFLLRTDYLGLLALPLGVISITKTRLFKYIENFASKN